jgi:hypothetical protein
MKRGFVLGLALAAVTVMLLGLGQLVQAGGGQWGDVKGKILWGGKDVPEQKPIPAVKGNIDEKACTMGGKHVLKDEKWVVNPKNKGLRWTFVWLTHEDVKNKEPLPTHPDLKAFKVKKIEMDQPMCMFIPHAMALREGQVLVARNSAAVAHSFKYAGNPTVNPGNNVLIQPGGAVDIKDLVADRLPVKIECTIHTWMNGWVGVFNHPYYAVTDADGTFEFKNAPAGKYRLMVWHGSGGWLGGAAGNKGRVINIKAGDTLDVGSLDYPPPKE